MHTCEMNKLIVIWGNVTCAVIPLMLYRVYSLTGVHHYRISMQFKKYWPIKFVQTGHNNISTQHFAKIVYIPRADTFDFSGNHLSSIKKTFY